MTNLIKTLGGLDRRKNILFVSNCLQGNNFVILMQEGLHVFIPSVDFPIDTIPNRRISQLRLSRTSFSRQSSRAPEGCIPDRPPEGNVRDLYLVGRTTSGNPMVRDCIDREIDARDNDVVSISNFLGSTSTLLAEHSWSPEQCLGTTGVGGNFLQ